MIAEGTSDELKHQIGGDRLRVTIANPANTGKAIDALTPLTTGAVKPDETGLTLTAPITAGDRVVPNAIRALDACGVDVLDVEVRRPTLDDVFLTLTGRSAEEEAEEDVPETEEAVAR